jgi:hypothetical protein
MAHPGNKGGGQMKKIFLTLLFMFTLLSAAYAEDYIEVKGRGLFGGTILSENSNEVKFKNNDGKTETFARSEVLLLERGLPGTAAVTSDSSASSFSFNSETPDTEERIKKGNVAARANLFIEKVGQIQGAFFIWDIPAFVQAITGLKDLQTRGKGPFMILGVILMLIGGLAFVFFAFMMLKAAFGEGVEWGILFLLGGFGGIAPRFGEWAVLIVHLTGFATTYFVITHFRAIRKPLIGGMICLNVVFLALFLLTRSIV